MTQAAAVAALIKEKKACILVTHIHPDGDALGSMLAMGHCLKQMGKTILLYMEEPVPALYRFLPGGEEVSNDLSRVASFAREHGGDLLSICVDCGDRQRLGRNGPELLTHRPFLVIDHHVGNNGFGEVAWIEPTRSSTGEMIYDLIRLLGVELSGAAAQCLFTAIITDTGGFRYEGTSSHTFAVASALVRAGADPAVISGHLYDNCSLGRLQLMQDVLSTLQVYNEGEVAVIRVTQEMLSRSGTTLGDTENLINLPRAVQTIKVAVFLKENDSDTISVSLRAKGGCDVAKVAAGFNGGGHRNASGFKVANQSMEQVLQALLPALRQQMS
jgi:bifunctional oligoribonuclease and PAP phosphatase NrnA